MSTEDRLRGLFKAKGDEIAASIDHESIQPEQQRRPSWLIAFAAAAIVLVVIGGVGLFVRSGDGPVVDEAADTTTTIQATAAASCGGADAVMDRGRRAGGGRWLRLGDLAVDGGFHRVRRAAGIRPQKRLRYRPGNRTTARNGLLWS